MKSSRRPAAVSLAAILAALVAVPAAAQPTLGALYASRASIPVQSDDALVRVSLPREVLDQLGPTLSATALFAASSPVEYVIESRPRGDDQEVASAPLIPIEATQASLATTPVTYVERYELAGPDEAAPGSPWELRIATPTPSFTAKVRILAAGPTGALLVERTIFRLADGIERDRLALPAGIAGRFRVEIETQDGLLGPTFSYVSTIPRTASVDERLLPLVVRSRRSTVDGVELVIDLDPHVHPSSLRVTSASGRTLEVVVFATQGSREFELGAGSIPVGAGGATRDLALARTSATSLRVVVRGARPDQALEIVGVLEDPSLVFDGAQFGYVAEKASLLFGGGRGALVDTNAASPLFDRLNDRIPERRISEIEPNPDFIVPPAFRFAMRPGARVDRRAYRAYATVTIPASPEGLTRVVVPAKVLLQANPGATDLRIVDADGRQWPYLVEQSTTVATTELAVRAVRTSGEGNVSRYRIALPDPGVVVVGVRARTDASIVDRAVTVESLAQSGATDFEQSGRLVRRSNAADELDVRLDADGDRRFRTLVVTITDGDDAPLDVSFSVLVPKRVLLVTARPGDYRLYVGALDATPESRPPSYELERASAVVGAVRTADAVVSAPVTNEESDPPAAFSKARYRDLALWAALIGVTAALFIMTFRLLRSSSPASPSADSAGPASQSPEGPREES